MKAVVLERPGGPEQLIYCDYPDPHAVAGEVVVRLKAAALNHRDIWMRLRPTHTPLILGSDGAGIIAAVGAEVSNVRIGDEVLINPSLGWPEGAAQPPGWRILGDPDDGSYAELIRLPAEAVYPRPAYLSWVEAAALPLSGLTAWRALVTRGNLQPGETVLVLGVGGGTGLALLQLAKALGANVWVTSGSDKKLARAKELGATIGINYRTSDWAAEVLQLTGGRGVPLIIDGVGHDTWAGSLKALQPAGRLVSYGVTSGPTAEVEIRTVFSRQLSILGTMMGNAVEFAAMLKFYTEVGLKPIIHTTLPLAEAAQAHRLLEAAQQFGKIVLVVEA
jgi:zinc-binding alcohol dehydrogenase/oxidoreductase